MQNLQRLRPKFLLLLLSICFISLLNSCKKELNYHEVNNVEIENFLKLPANASPELGTVTNALRKQLNENYFVNDFLNNNRL